MLACGADMKGAFAFAQGVSVYLEDGFGDLADVGNLERYEKAVIALSKYLEILPKVVVCDLHPGYFSTRFAEAFHEKIPGVKLCKVQHHEAHIASAIAENFVKGDVIGVAFDGTGFGSDGKIWGGEFFTGSPKEFTRAGHLEYVAIPGGDAAVREPWRMALSYLYRAFGDKAVQLKIISRRGHKKNWPVMKKMIDEGINSPLTSSAGRLFDGVASLILNKDTAGYEAELPIMLEKLVPQGYEEHYDFDLKNEEGVLVVRLGRIIESITRDISTGVDKRLLAGKFHNTVAEIVIRMVAAIGKKSGLKKVVLSGGVFQNKYLTTKAKLMLEKSGYKVYTHFGISTTDAGIPLGQIAIAQARGICV